MGMPSMTPDTICHSPSRSGCGVRSEWNAVFGSGRRFTLEAGVADLGLGGGFTRATGVVFRFGRGLPPVAGRAACDLGRVFAPLRTSVSSATPLPARDTKRDGRASPRVARQSF